MERSAYVLSLDASPAAGLHGFPKLETKEVLKMNATQNQECIMYDETLPVHPHLKSIRIYDGLYPDDEEERTAYWDFISWAMAREHAVLEYIPKQTDESDFWISDSAELGNYSSAFNTVDFKRLHPYKFNKYNYRVKKVFEKVRDLALLHSCLSDADGKKNTYLRYKSLVQNEFRDQAETLLEN